MGTFFHVGDARIDSVVDIDRFDIAFSFMFPDADIARLDHARSWLEPLFMAGGTLHLAMQSFVLRVGGRTVLIDTCVGEHKERVRHPAWHRRSDTRYLAGLAALGLSPADIDVVFCTHLHADHVGWNTRLVDGRWVPTFPNARYLFGRTELAHWSEQYRSSGAAINHGAYADSVLPAIEAGQVDVVDDGQEVACGCTVRPLSGHTPGQVGLTLRRGGVRAIFAGDAIHHPLQLVRPEWSSALCADRAAASATRAGLLAEAAETGGWLVPAHFPGALGYRIAPSGDGYSIAGTA